MKKVIIIGATSGIGRELSKVYSRNGWAVGMAGRRESLFPEIEKEMKGEIYFKRIDVTAQESALLFEELIAEMGGVDVVVISSGTGFVNRELDWSKEKETIDVNVSGFALLAGTAFRYFCGNGGGCVAGISSIATIGLSAAVIGAGLSFVGAAVLSEMIFDSPWVFAPAVPALIVSVTTMLCCAMGLIASHETLSARPAILLSAD